MNELEKDLKAKVNEEFEKLFEGEDFDTWLEKHPDAVVQGHAYDGQTEKSTAQAEENKKQGDF